ncbi:MAG TPA: Gfo/Idh/MocA family oxidoreductase [Acidobacteriota bacterium]|nr:Gfo/Idh/MocA family oxidoreductase [Acidobacteriota bacterium]
MTVEILATIESVEIEKTTAIYPFRGKKNIKEFAMSPSKSTDGRIRYAVVGLGYIAQVAVLPSFKHASKNSELSALVSDDPEKLQSLSNEYSVQRTANYEQYADLLRSGEVDAVYIALPNHLHAEYTIRAAEAGIHVLCEKPMAVTSQECIRMIEAAEQNGIKLMIAYRLHFEKANLKAVEIVKNGKLGVSRFFDSTHSMQVREGNVRLVDENMGGGPVYDIGIYCLNAARYLFRAEPNEVFAFSATGESARFKDANEMTSAVLRFPDERLATFTCSFGAADTSMYKVVGTEGDLRVEPAFEYAGDLIHHLTLNGKTRKRTFKKRDQFAPEIEYFSNCILRNKTPEPSGEEGLIDVHIIEAILESAREGRPVSIAPVRKSRRPEPDQEISKPGIEKPELINAEAASRE